MIQDVYGGLAFQVSECSPHRSQFLGSGQTGSCNNSSAWSVRYSLPEIMDVLRLCAGASEYDRLNGRATYDERVKAAQAATKEKAKNAVPAVQAAAMLDLSDTSDTTRADAINAAMQNDGGDLADYG